MQRKCENFHSHFANFFAKFRTLSRKWMTRKKQNKTKTIGGEALFVILMNFAFIFKIPSFFVKFSHFFANFITSYFAKISYFSRNILKRNFAKKRKISRKLFSRGKCEIFAKQFFLFAANPSLEWESMSSVKPHGVLSSECELIWSVKFKVWSYVKRWV